MSDWIIEMSDGSLIGQERRISSAYRMTVEEEEKGNWKMSLTYKMKRKGSKNRTLWYTRDNGDFKRSSSLDNNLL